MELTLSTNIPAEELFAAMRESPLMQGKGYTLLYENKYDGGGCGLCYVDSTGRKTYIHVRIYGDGAVSSFEYGMTLDVEKTADRDMNELFEELERKFSP